MLKGGVEINVLDTAKEVGRTRKHAELPLCPVKLLKLVEAEVYWDDEFW